MKSIAGAGPFARVVLPDLRVAEVLGKEEDEMHDINAARAVVPGKIREHRGRCAT